MNNVLDDLKNITDKCINCGFCEAVCPTLEAFSFVSSEGARGRINIAIRMVEIIKSDNVPDKKLLKPFYSCLNCNACLYVCPASISAGEASSKARIAIVSESIATHIPIRDPVADMIVEMIMKYSSPLGISKKGKRWVKNLEFDRQSDTLFYTGQMYLMAAYSKTFSNMEISMGNIITKHGANFIKRFPFILKILSTLIRPKDLNIYKEAVINIYTLLIKAGVKMNFFENEPYPGTFLLDLGYEEEFRKYATEIFNKMKEAGIKNVITIDPHTYSLLKYSYPRYVKGFNLNVSFYLDMLQKIEFKKLDKKVIFHEPCHLVRSEKSYFNATNILNGITDLVLPDNNGINTFCCGGPDELLYPEIAEKISNKRYNELREKGRSEIVTACPVCLSNLRKDNNVKDMSHVLSEAVRDD